MILGERQIETVKVALSNDCGKGYIDTAVIY